MKIVGIIAEYNPFHTGHAYHIQETRRQTGADYIIVVMSGDFVQRGAPAFLPKHIRTQMALLGGADMVFELPATHACQSAEFFAHAGVSLLNGLGCVDFLSFGSESGDTKGFQLLGDFLSKESEEYQQLLKTELKKGVSYPTARQRAIASAFSPSSFTQDIHSLLSSPNNILGIEYCKALTKLNSTMKPFTIKRTGSNYHEQTLQDTFPSASAIRSYCSSPENLRSKEITYYFPERVAEYIHNKQLWNEILTEQDFSLLLRWVLFSHSSEALLQYMDVNPELANRLTNTRSSYENFSQYVHLLKTKELTYSRLCRSLFHILLEIREVPPLSYARLLGFRKSAASVLGEIKKNGTVPLVTKLADAPSYLNAGQLSLLEKNITISHLYETVLSEKYQRPFIHEYTKNMIIL